MHGECVPFGTTWIRPGYDEDLEIGKSVDFNVDRWRITTFIDNFLDYQFSFMAVSFYEPL